MKKALSVIGRGLGRLLFNSKTAVLLFVLAIGAGGAAYYFYDENHQLKENPNAASEKEIKEMTGKVGILMDLPTDENPSIISVVDKAKLADQPFFAKAENGDKVLVYANAKKAILYRPSTNKIVEVGPVDITPNQTYKAVLLNGSSDTTAADRAESTLAGKVTNLEITNKADAKSKFYAATQVIDLNGDQPEEAKQLAEILGGEVAQMPANETRPEVDFLIIAAD